MGSCTSKPPCCSCRNVMTKLLLMSMRATTTRRRQGAAVHPWTPPEVPPGQRVTVRMRASEFRALAAASNDDVCGDVVVAQLILDGCAVGRWAWSPEAQEL